MSLGERIKFLRNKNGWTQTYLGEKISVTKASISGYENDTRNPDKETLIKIANLFNVTTDYLLGREEVEKTTQYTSDDLDKMLDNAMSFDGKPMTDHDREVIRAYLEGKFGSN
ncbi:helix-turn-helix domain-containing protein [Tetragenococcus halophilus]|uniref:helix-turn-helix domain-containing protein n=1 Tax=Tetragenococcus halophilus TaxID=51669 RepID=UPI00077C821A|nr:helix-turn-helix transcriptional regulator [Tetragenococcus halophilus]NWO00829.1 helix-turn-helix transcriptional regulator [Tetragenococcus halophilus]